MERIPCCVCGSESHSRVWARIAADEYAPRVPGAPPCSRWVVCRDCGLVFQNPRPDGAEVAQMYSGSGYRDWDEVPDEFFTYARRRALPVLQWLETLPEYRELMKQPAEQRAVLDVGCGVGGAVKGLTDLDWRAFGVEPDPMLARAGSERFGVTIVPEFMHRDLLPEVDFSLVFSLHTFEHLLDPLDVVRSARELLTRGGSKRGYIFIAVPTWSHATHPAWEWMNTSHTYLFSANSLGNLLARAGFRMLHSNYPKPDYHPCSEPSEVWVFGELDPAADSAVDSTDRLPYREKPLSVQSAMALVPLRWPLAAIGRRLRRTLRGLTGGGRSNARPAPSGAEKS